MVNIIYNGNNTVRFTQLDTKKSYNLTDLRIFIPDNKKLISLFCVFKNDNNDFDTIKLSQSTSDSKNYNCYVFTPEQVISLGSGKLKLFLFGIYEDKTFLFTDEFEMNLVFENYNLTGQLYMLHQLNSEIANYYNKIVSMTELNIQISKDIKETIEGGIK